MKIMIITCWLFFLSIGECWQNWTSDEGPNPGTRQGHSMVLYGSKIIIFGGRTDDITVPHVPKTYAIHQVDGKLEFETYDTKEVNPVCKDGQTDGCTTSPQQSTVGKYFNDVWSYDLDCPRYADEKCLESTWRQIEKGVKGGGCKIVYGAEICTHPTERWFHGAEVFNDDTMVIYGGFSQRCDDYCDDIWAFDFLDNSWTEVAEINNPRYGPGKRWKFSSVTDGFDMYIFGGFRIWHGFSTQNSKANNWEDFSVYPQGGLVLTNCIETTSWTKKEGIEECYHVKKIEWEERNAEKCTINWPSGRAGHTSVLLGDLLFIHGGYQTFFPYPSSTGPGSGRGIVSDPVQGFSPYPTSPYYLDDMWQYNLTSGFWKMIQPVGSVRPPPRQDHIMVAAGDVFVLFGGYRSNYYYDDTWQYNTTASQWLKQELFVHELYPDSCTDDLQHRKEAHSGVYRPWHDIPDTIPPEDGFTFIKERHYGTTNFSVKAWPTYNQDALASDQHVFISQARRQAPGWDGCRDRQDGRTDLPSELQWRRPSQRAAHRAVYHKEIQIVLIYGGYGFTDEMSFQVNKTQPSITKGDMWQYSLAKCAKNCSMHGDCSYGRCLCHDGYYGSDCSNSTCPGSTCVFNERSKRQSCVHCCFAGYEHTHDDTYVPNVKKLPCTEENPGFVNGVCDGFGKCICRPPFIGEDCSIRDCMHNCSGHGYCNVEFPNSRCMCDMGWIGQYCDQRVCLNNCSYPNGLCYKGECWCKMLYDPYNKTNSYYPFMGEDCSYVVPFAGATVISMAVVMWIFIMLVPIWFI